MEDDRRQFLRVDAELSVNWSPVTDGVRGDPVRGQTVNVSAGGAKLHSPQPLAVGDRVWLELRFESPRFLVFCEADVVRADEDGLAPAVRFLDLDVYVEQRIVRWVYAEDRRIYDRRAQVRIPLRLRIVCRRLDAEGRPVEEFAAPSIDIAADGLRIVTERVLPAGTALALDIHIDDGREPATAGGRVAWRAEQPDGRTAYGISLHDVDHRHQRELIERCLAVERANRQ